tara:strand:+ start:20227 stop:21003 length:777 start_codon:yes stop_codon:yes gene_type:complete
MRAIILAAGTGSRLSSHTYNKPKGMIKFLDKPLLKHQIDAFKSKGIEDITIVRGYKSEKINFDNITYFENLDFQKTNMVISLLCAKEKLNTDIIVTYSDLVLEERNIDKLLKSEYDIGVLVDDNFETYWKSRLGSKYINDMESLSISNNEIISLGNTNPAKDEVDGRYVGAIKFSKIGIDFLVKHSIEKSKTESLNKLGTRKFKNWHMTDLLQSIIDSKFPINPIITSGGWLEFDTDEDYEIYNAWHHNNTLKRFIEI